MSPLLQTTLLLICSHVFMTFAVLYIKQPLKLNYLRAAPRTLRAALALTTQGSAGSPGSGRSARAPSQIHFRRRSHVLTPCVSRA
jgi:hypothetical protein